MIKEFCTSNSKDISMALQAGANRIELCANLEVGGLTPSEEMIFEATKEAKNKVMVIIRPRAGNFVYNQDELKLMSEQIVTAKKYEIEGIVLGALTNKNTLDIEAMEYLLPFIGNLDITFHMAFDEMDLLEQKKAIKWFSEHGIYRVLMHGGSLKENILDTLPRIAKIMAYAKEYNVTIMPGGGITYQNLEKIEKKVELEEVHGTKIVKF